MYLTFQFTISNKEGIVGLLGRWTWHLGVGGGRVCALLNFGICVAVGLRHSDHRVHACSNAAWRGRKKQPLEYLFCTSWWISFQEFSVWCHIILTFTGCGGLVSWSNKPWWTGNNISCSYQCACDSRSQSRSGCGRATRASPWGHGAFPPARRLPLIWWRRSPSPHTRPGCWWSPPRCCGRWWGRRQWPRTSPPSPKGTEGYKTQFY